MHTTVPRKVRAAFRLAQLPAYLFRAERGRRYTVVTCTLGRRPDDATVFLDDGLTSRAMAGSLRAAYLRFAGPLPR